MSFEIPTPSLTFEVPLEDGARIRMRRHGNPDGVRTIRLEGRGKLTGQVIDERSQPVEGAEALFIEAAEKALADAQLSADEIDTIVTVCSTGIATPSLEARVAGRLGFRSDVTRVPVFGRKCRRVFR